jgi:hypothetical protein
MTELILSNLDKTALFVDVALEIYTLEDLAVLHNVSQDELSQLLDTHDAKHRIASLRKELNEKGEYVERRANYSLANVIIPELINAAQDLETTPDELVKIGTLMQKLSGADRKAAEKVPQRQLPSINIFLGDDSKPTTSLKIINPQTIAINQDVDDVVFSEANDVD